MSDQKLTTAEIIARIRGSAPQAAQNADAPEKQSADATAEPAAAETAPAESSASSPKPAAPTPGSTSDILAAIKSGGAGAGGAQKPAATDKPAAAASGGPPPAGTAGILAAIRGGGAPAAAAESKKGAAPAKSSAQKAAVDTSKASGLTAAEMIRLAREGKKPQPETAAATGGAPKLPPLPKEPLRKPAAKPEPSRRSFLGYVLGLLCSPIVWAWSSLVAATVTSGLAMARFMMPNVLVEPPTKFKIGPPSDFPPGTVSTKFKAQFGVWIVNDEINGQQMIYALSTVCTHLGCTPNWLEGEQKFKCPCHGSGFYKTGINFEGPAPRPLERYAIRIAEDGMLEVDKSRKFQQELGQWEDPASYVPV